MSPARAWKYAKWAGALLLLGLVTAIVLPRFGPSLDLRIIKAFYDIGMLGKILSWYRKDHGELPTDTAGLGALTGYYLDKSPVDPWANLYVYRRANNPQGYELYSRGANGIDENGDGDDVTDPSKHYSCKTYGVDCPGDVAVRYVALSAVAAAVAGLCGFLAFSGIALYGRLRGLSEEI